MQLITATLSAPDASLSEVSLRGGRLTVAKRIWRGRAEEGGEFGFELAAPHARGFSPPWSRMDYDS